VTFTPFALVPLTGTAFYLLLVFLVKRNGRAHRGAWEFMLHLAFLATWSAFSFAWRLSGDGPAAEYFLRLLEVPLFSIPGTFVIFLQAFYPTRWSSVARRVGIGLIGIATVASLSGAVNRLGVDPEPPSELWPHALFYLALASTVLTYAFGYAYFGAAFRGHRDPFDRNRLTFAVVAMLLIMVGSLTNLAEILRVLPVDQAANASAATLLALAIVRYRLFDINVLLKRGAIHAVTVGLTSLAFGAGVTLGLSVTGADLLTREGVGVAVVVAAVVGLCVSWIHGGIERLVDRTFVGTWTQHAAPLAELARRTERVQSVDDLARTVTGVCQTATASSFVALLATIDDEGEDLRVIGSAGPHPRSPALGIRRENHLLQMVATAVEPVTPARLAALMGETSISAEDVEEFAPYLDCVVVPVSSHGRCDGVLVVGPKIYAENFSLADIQFLGAAATRTALALQNAQLYTRLRDQAQTDFLTGLPNHRQLQDLLASNLWMQAASETERFSIAMVDVDNFKLFNEVHGHQTGDDVLRRVAKTMRATLRPGDTLGRYGGDEFLLILPGTTLEEARAMMSTLARSVRKVAVDASDSELSAAESLPVRISWGVASCPDDASEVRGLVSTADSRLMQERFRMRRSGTVRDRFGRTDEDIEQDAWKLRVARGLLDIIDTKDPYTSEHSQQIAAFSLLVADEARLSDRERYALWLGSLLHDVGKIGTPTDTLRKPGRLTPEELEAMRRHPSLGETIVRGLLAMPEVTEIVGCHHERWDGGGYPRGLAGEEIPRLVRIVSVIDAFSAMVHDRPYRKGLAWSDAVVELRRFAGTQFDPEAVETFVRAIGHDRTAISTASAA